MRKTNSIHPLSVERDARSISRRVFSGNRDVCRKKENHVANIAEKIRKRWGIPMNAWQVKHLRWFLQEYLKHHSNGTRYRYFRIIREVLIYKNRWDDWERYLQGQWIKP